MTNFNYKRFGKVVGCTVADNRKFYMQTAGACAAIVIATVAINIFLVRNRDSVNYTDMIAKGFFSASFIYLLTCGSLIVSNISEKNKRISAFMLPASKLEKFIARYIHLLIFIPLAAFVGIVVGDVLQMAYSSFFVNHVSPVTSAFIDKWKSIFITEPFISVSDLVKLYFALIFIHSLYLLVGVVFRRHAWIKSNITIIFGSFILIFAVMLICKFILDAIYGKDMYSIIGVNTMWTYILEDAAFALITEFNFWLTFRIYSRMQVAANKWYNL